MKKIAAGTAPAPSIVFIIAGANAIVKVGAIRRSNAAESTQHQFGVQT
jgi:hypothetical protein